jgi:hypothetical protein
VEAVERRIRWVAVHLATDDVVTLFADAGEQVSIEVASEALPTT